MIIFSIDVQIKVINPINTYHISNHKIYQLYHHPRSQPGPHQLLSLTVMSKGSISTIGYLGHYGGYLVHPPTHLSHYKPMSNDDGAAALVWKL